MHFSTAVAPLVLAGLSAAQSSGASTVQVQVVKVGGNNGELTFSPSDIQAPVGSMVQFQFYPKNHSVAQSTFANPCMPIANVESNVTNPLWSGFMPTAEGATMLATYTIMVNNTTPIWLYCAQADHCQKGMVAAINSNNASAKSLSAFSTLATKATANIAPGDTSAGSGGVDGTTNATNSTGSGSPAATSAGVSGSSPAASTTPTSGTKVGNSASSISYGTSSVVFAGLLSVVAGLVL